MKLDLFRPIKISDELIRWFRKNGIFLKEFEIPTFDNVSGKINLGEPVAPRFYKKYNEKTKE